MTVSEKQRWTLIQTGVDRKKIKIRNSRLFVDGNLHGKVANSQYHLSTTDTPLDSESDATSTTDASFDSERVDATSEVTPVPSDN